MTTHRVHKNSNYSVIHNEAVANYGLGWKARGILWYLLTKPDTWECRTEDLVKAAPGGESAVTAALVELEKHGYLVRWKERDKSGRFHYRSEVFECKDLKSEWEQKNAEKLKAATRFKGRKTKAMKSTPEESTCGKSPSGQNTDSAVEARPRKSTRGKALPLVNTEEANTEENQILSCPEAEDTSPPMSGAANIGQSENKGSTSKGLDFESFWKWYRLVLCHVPVSFGQRVRSEGKKYQARAAWKELEKRNWYGRSPDDFRKACKIFLDKMRETGGYDISHACRFLYVSQKTPPPWLAILEEAEGAESIGDDDFMTGSPDVETLLKLVGAEMDRTNTIAYLPLEKRKETGKNLVSELDFDQLREYLDELKTLPTAEVIRYA